VAEALDTQLNEILKLKAAELKALERLGLRTVRDLLLHLPFAIDDYAASPVGALDDGQQATVFGRLGPVELKRPFNRRAKPRVETTLTDDRGSSLRVVWFNQPWQAKKFMEGDRVALAGTVKAGRYRGLEMVNPQTAPIGDGNGERAGVGGLQPKYHLTAGLSSAKLAAWAEQAMHLAGGLDDPVPELVRRRHRLMSLPEAVRAGHKPNSLAEWSEAQQRLVWGELFELQSAFLVARHRYASEVAEPIPYRQDVIENFKSGLGFELTLAQRRSVWEVFKDLQQRVPMNRLLDGDVGSGKTAVAAAAAAMAHAAGYQTVVMAPTEILARQHLQKFRTYLEDRFPDLRVDLLVSGLAAAERRRVLTATASGHNSVLVGTHALLEGEVEFARLGLAVVDEQHRFGTRQRESLRRKGRPHFLAMTATPIPRTLALALYGEMALSLIDEMPLGRLPVTTEVVTPDRRGWAYELVRREVRSGHQAFVICPLIEESETIEVRAATAEFERLRKEVFPDLRLSLVHGRVRDKDAVMQAFRAGESDVLVATPVIEVGVDVANATVMMIEGADRFGLAQLHQFRGRVGRGSAPSHALLLADDPGEAALHRLNLVAHLHDGFRLANEDMELRGTGQMIGTRQHGISDQAMVGLKQPELISEIRQEAELLVQADPDLDGHPALRQAVDRRLEQTSIS
jgi:ATP-dependent DNA helicase RecG